jgi:hypothetical protein
VSAGDRQEETHMEGTAAGGIALAVAAVLLWKDRLPKITALLMLAAGAGITGGVIGRLMQRGVDWAAGWVGQLTSQAIGVAVPAVLAVVFTVLFIHDMWPHHPATRVTAVVAFFVPVLAVGLPGAAGSVLSSALDALRSVTTGAVASIFGGA